MPTDLVQLLQLLRAADPVGIAMLLDLLKDDPQRAADAASALRAATNTMEETQMSFNLEYLQLQSEMQSMNRRYTAISNIMKTKHDTVKNSISNIR